MFTSSSNSMWLILVVLFCNTITLLGYESTWKNTQRFPSDKIPDDALNTDRMAVRRKIVLYHNFFRTKVKPTASNMLLMSWHEGSAKQAKNYADQCIFLEHNSIDERVVNNLGGCGQNIFVASKKAPWFFGIKTWFLEYKNFTYGAPVRNLRAVGHYTQMVWATSHKVGCGVSRCKGGPWGVFYNYVCHYCPSGNVEGSIQYPYKIGQPCADCPRSCVAGKLCNNPCYGKDDYSNCQELVSIDRSSICLKSGCNATCGCGTRRIHQNYPWN